MVEVMKVVTEVTEIMEVMVTEGGGEDDGAMAGH